MKLSALFVLLMFSSISFASQEKAPVWPTIFNYGTSLLVQVQNTTQETISCSGSVYAYLNDGRMQSFYYFDTIPRGSFGSRYFSVFGQNIRIVSYNHFINCH